MLDVLELFLYNYGSRQAGLPSPVHFDIYAGVAQLIERFLAKEEVESLSLFTRTK